MHEQYFIFTQFGFYIYTSQTLNLQEINFKFTPPTNVHIISLQMVCEIELYLCDAAHLTNGKKNVSICV